MKKEIIHFLSDYITAFSNYKESLEQKSIIENLTSVYNELLSIAENNAGSYTNFKKECRETAIFDRFDSAIKKCREEFDKHI